jgi:hypothetical protein
MAEENSMNTFVRIALSSLLSSAMLINPALVVADQPLVIAKLTNLNGPVMVNDGVRYQPANPTKPLTVGTKVMVPQGGQANLVFSNGCVKPIKQNSILTINSLYNVPTNSKDCAAAFVQERAYQVAAVGDVSPPATIPPASAGIGAGTIALGALGAVAFIAAGIDVGNDSDDKRRPASGI